MRLAGTNLLVTGASRGLGRAICAAAWREGANLFATARDGKRLQDLAGECRATLCIEGQRIAAFACDLAAAGAAPRVIEAALSKLGRVDALILCAAIQGPAGPAWELDPAEIDAAIQVNLLAPMRLALAAVPAMRREGRGRIIIVSGGGAAAPRPRFASYATAKAGLVRFAETLAEELAGTGVLVNAIAPGAMATDMLRGIIAAGPGRAGDKEVAAAEKVLSGDGDASGRAVELALFLASRQSDGISGRLISAVWDKYLDWPAHLDALAGSDLYTLRRITGRDRGQEWGDR